MLVVLGAVLLFVGTVSLYAREQVLDRDAFVDRADEALRDDDVRRVVARKIVVNLIDRGSADLVAARPLLESVVAAIAQTDPFRRLFRRAAVEANRVFFDRGRSNALVNLGDTLTVVEFAVRSVSPKLAKEIPKDFDPEVITLSRDDFAGRTLSTADSLRLLGWLLPALALAAFAGAVALAPDRRLALLYDGVGVAAAGALLTVALLVLRSGTLAGVTGDDDVTDEEARDAVAGVLDAYLGDMFMWGLALALVGVVVAGAAAALDPDDVQAPAQRLTRRLLEPPSSVAGRALRGVAIAALGVAVVILPTLALQIVAVAGGSYLLFVGVTELIVLLQRRDQSEAEGEAQRRRALVTALGLAGAAVAGLVLLLVALTGADPTEEPDSPAAATGCNGSRALCDLPLNEAAFAGTHNAFSAGDDPGWYIVNQRRTVERQLEDGIRLFLIDAHWGVEASGGVRTDFASEGRSRNKVAKALPPDVLAAAERLVGRLGVGDATGERDVFLCHTVCELGATRMVDTLVTYREFLEANPGAVLILFVEPYVTPNQIAKRFKEAGLDPYLAELSRDEPLPTLGELVDSDRRVIVFSEKDADGTLPWYLDGFSFVQDTPLGAQRVSELRCRRERGTADSPLLMLNHWADIFPPRANANRPFLTERVLLERAHRCAAKRGMPVSLIAVDHYEQGDLIEAVDKLNAEHIEAARARGAG